MAGVSVLAGAVLVLTAGTQLYDTNFQTLWEATALLLGDHPYRDFFEWGLILQAGVSAVAQVLTGHRLIGEFLVHWIFIIAGIVISLHLAIRGSRSITASLVTMSLALILLASTPTYHYPKLFFYPLALWLAWRYLERPGVGRAAALGITTAVAFLFRHDHGVYIGILAVIVFGLARAAVPASRKVRAMGAESAVYTGAAALLLLPWLVMVQRSEGVPEYVRARAYIYEEWSARGTPWLSLLSMNPIRTLVGEPSPPPERAAVRFKWSATLDAAERLQLERQYALRPLQDGPENGGWWRYEVPNVHDAALWRLRFEMEDADSAEGLDWDQLERLQQPWLVPTRDAAELWLYQVVLLIPILLMISAGIAMLRSRRQDTSLPLDAARAVAAAAFLLVIQRSLREPSYALAVVPLIAGVSPWLLTGSGIAAPPARAGGRGVWPAVRWGLAAVMLVVTSLATFAYTRGTGLFHPLEGARRVRPVFAELMTSPPIDGYLSSAGARGVDRQIWDTGGVDKGRLLIRYIHDCSREDDRILVTGSTPYHVHYYANRSVAGGHVFWHIGWRSDTMRQMQLLALLQSQSVPFAFSTHDPVLADLTRYPLIHEYFSKHYVELDGTEGRLLVDTRRPPMSRYGRLGFPCFA